MLMRLDKYFCIDTETQQLYELHHRPWQPSNDPDNAWVRVVYDAEEQKYTTIRRNEILCQTLI